MKILLAVHCYYPDHFYGTEAYVRSLAAQFKLLGHQPVIYAASFPGEYPYEPLLQRYQHNGVDVIRLNKSLFPHQDLGDTYRQPELAPVHRAVLEEQQPDVLHVAHLINHTASLVDVANELGIPMVATLTDFYGFCYTNKLEDARGRMCNGPNLARSNCVACYLKARAAALPPPLQVFHRLVREPLAAALSMLACVPLLRYLRPLRSVEALIDRPRLLASCLDVYRAVIFPTAVLERAYRSNGLVVSGMRSSFGLDIDRESSSCSASEGTLRIGYVGQIAAHKGVDLLIKAFRHLPQLSADLVLYGPVDQDPAYLRRLRRLARGMNVRFAGTFEAERMSEVLAEFDVLVIPSRWYENSPLVLLSALACHCPVIVSDVPGLTEQLKDGQNGFRFRRGDWSDLTHQLKRFLEDPGLAARLANTTHFSRTTAEMAGDVLDLYRKVLA